MKDVEEKEGNRWKRKLFESTVEEVLREGLYWSDLIHGGETRGSGGRRTVTVT